MIIRGLFAGEAHSGWSARLHILLSGRFWVLFALLVILGLAAFLRLTDLTELPPPLHVDEASQGVNGLAVANGDVSPLRLGFTHHLNTAFLLTGIVLKVFDTTVWNLRIPEVAAGIAAVLLTYVLGRTMFSWRVGLVAALLLAVNHFAIAFSRIGLVNQQAMTVELLAFYLLWKGFRDERQVLVFLGGAAVAAGLYLYFGAWIMPVILGPFSLWMLTVRRETALRHWRLSAWGLLGFLLFVIPWLSFPILNGDEFFERPSQVSILSDMDHYKDYWQTDSALEVFRLQTKNTIEFLNRGRDTSNQYGYDDPFFDPISIWLFAVGVAIALIRLRQPTYGFLLVWFGVTLVIGGILTDTPPFMPRLVGLFPPIVLLAAVGLVKPIELLLGPSSPARRPLVIAGVGVALAFLAVFSFLWNYDAYFQKYPVAPYTIYWPWIEPSSTIGRYLESLPEGSEAYLFRTRAVHASQPSIQFYIHDDRIDLQDVICNGYPCSVPSPGSEGLTTYLFVPGAMGSRLQVHSQFPGGISRSFSGHSSRDGSISLLFVAYEVQGGK